MADVMERFVQQVREIVRAGETEHEVTAQVAARMKDVIGEPDLLAPQQMQPKLGSYVLHPVHVEADGSFAIAAAVWDVGQITPIHDHGTWGVIGIYRGVEHEERFRRPERVPLNQPVPLEHLETWDIPEGKVIVCCTSDKDIHRVSCGSRVPCVGLHVYGADIGAIERHAYNAKTGRVTTFISGWD